MLLPLVHSTAMSVGVYLHSVCVRYHNRTLGPPNRAPDHVWTSIGHSAVVDDDGLADTFAEVQRGVGQDVVYGVIRAIGRGVANWQFVYEDPFLDRWNVLHDGHARAGNVLFVGYIVYDWAPIPEVGRCLVGKLLAVLRVALIRVVGDQLAFVLANMLST